MPEPLTIDRLIDAGVHFGCRTNRWNPKMKPFILGKRHLIHLIDLRQTVRGLLRAEHFLTRLASSGAQILFVGTKRPVRTVVEEQAKRCAMPYVTERWIGGTLTNFAVIRKRLARLEELEKMQEDGSLERTSKKIAAGLRREKEKIARNLEGMRTMTRPPGAIVIVDPRREEIAAQEAYRTGIPSICVLDTDCDPDLADIPIPGNDDAIKSVSLLLTRLAEAALEGKAANETAEMADERASEPFTPPGRGDSSDRRGRERASARVGAADGGAGSARA